MAPSTASSSWAGTSTVQRSLVTAASSTALGTDPTASSVSRSSSRVRIATGPSSQRRARRAGTGSGLGACRSRDSTCIADAVCNPAIATIVAATSAATASTMAIPGRRSSTSTGSSTVETTASAPGPWTTSAAPAASNSTTARTTSAPVTRPIWAARYPGPCRSSVVKAALPSRAWALSGTAESPRWPDYCQTARAAPSIESQGGWFRRPNCSLTNPRLGLPSPLCYEFPAAAEEVVRPHVADRDGLTEHLALGAVWVAALNVADADLNARRFRLLLGRTRLGSLSIGQHRPPLWVASTRRRAAPARR